jgi:hypothetical protein
LWVAVVYPAFIRGSVLIPLALMYVRTFRPNRTIGLSATALYRFTVCRIYPSYHHMSYLRNSLMLFWLLAFF